MKLTIFLVFIIASTNTFAQKGEALRDQAPRHSDAKVPFHSDSQDLVRPTHSKVKVTNTTRQAPGTIKDPESAPISNEKLFELVKVQTNAIQSLSKKIDELELRIRQVESRPQ